EYAQALVQAFVRQVLRPRDKTRAIGFKEIRYGGVEFPKKEETLDYLWFLRNNFPNARFVFNERNIDDTARSAWWKDNKDAKKTIGNLAERMRLMFSGHKEVSCWVSYDDYKSDVESIAPLFEFLGEVFDKDRVVDVVSKRHSY